jgi:hypothetical protein
MAIPARDSMELPNSGPFRRNALLTATASLDCGALEAERLMRGAVPERVALLMAYGVTVNDPTMP